MPTLGQHARVALWLSPLLGLCSFAWAAGSTVATPKPIVSLTATPDKVLPGGNVQLRWESSNATSCLASGAPFAGTRNTSGSETLSKLSQGDKRYTLTCKGAGGSTAASTTVKVIPAPTLEFTSRAASVAENTGTRLQWTALNAIGCLASGDWSGERKTSGFLDTGALKSTKAYTLRCSGLTGEITRTVTVSVVPAPRVTISVSKSVVAPGESVEIRWSATDAESCSATGTPFTGGKDPAGGTQQLANLTKGLKRFTLTCKGAGGSTAADTSVTVAAKPKLVFSASLTQLQEKNTGTLLKWTATDATSCSASGAWSGAKKPVDTASTGPLSTSRRYTLRCTGPNGHDEQSVDISVLPAPKVTLTLSETTVPVGASVTLQWSSERADQCRASGTPFTGTKSLSGEETLGKLTSGDKIFRVTCTGGGGSSFAERRLSVTSKPTITRLVMDKPVVRVGSTATLSWATINTTRCEATGSWSGAREIRGQTSYAPKSSGRYEFVLECTGAAGTTRKAITVAVPHVPLSTSYQNKNAVPFDKTQVPSVRTLNLTQDAEEWDSGAESITIGDFFQEGRFSVFVSTLRSRGLFGIKNVSDSPGKAYFLALDDSGQWRDRTTELLPSPADRETCTTLSHALTADFNNDARPDIFLSCAGRAHYNPLPTGESDGTHPKYAETHLAKPILYLSSGERGYRRVELPYLLYASHASTADLNGDGNIDVAVANMSNLPKKEDRTPFVLLGNGDGSFRRNDDLLPLKRRNGRPTAWDIGGVLGIHLLPLDGRLDVVLVGYNSTAWFRGKPGQPGQFDLGSRRLIEMPVSPRTGNRYYWPPDVVLAQDSFYFVSSTCFDEGCDWVLVRTDLRTLTPVLIPVLTNLNRNYQPTSPQARPALDGSIVAYTAQCPVNNVGMCGMRVRPDVGQTLANLETLRYIASHPDLIDAFGTDIAKGRAHYEKNAANQGRKITFDPLIYVASNPDLIDLLGTDQEKAARHYIDIGYRARRVTSGFDPLRYIASHGDLIETFGLDTTAATKNYIRFGFAEGRKVTFDPLAYIASFGDLITRFGTDVLSAAEHYIQQGFDEGRRIAFDALRYIASYADLIRKFALDTVGATRQYIETGFSAGKRMLFDVTAYLANNADIRTKFGTDTIAATRDYITSAFSKDPPLTRSPDSPTTRYDAHRFLVQTTFGPTESEITRLLEFGYSPNGYERWIDAEIAKPISSILPTLIARTPVDRNNMGASQMIADRVDLWFRNAMLGEDQLRQRVAFALSQIMVVSDNGALLEYPYAVADFHDMLSRNAFGNFRTLLESVTLHPAMGFYLSMYGNQKAVEGTNLRPDENYAREMMQLFTIGLVELNIDGTRRLDATGQPIPTYNQDTIRGFARVFTGWKARCFSYIPPDQCFQRAYLVPWPNEDGFNQGQPMVVHEGFHEPGSKQLLIYPGVALAGGVIPPNQGGEKDLQLALDNAFNHPNVGPFISRQLIQKLISSNPSTDYVKRVAEVFNNDGSGARGNLKAVVKAILLDPEARNPGDSTTAGKVKEPLLRMTQLWRIYGDGVPEGKFIYTLPGGPATTLGQSPGQSPSVFNFFSPFYAPPGEIASTGLVAPELQLANENLHTQLSGAFYAQAHYQNNRSTRQRGDSIFINIDAEMRLADDVDALIDLVAKKLLGSPEAMSSTLREETRRQLRRWTIDQTFTDNPYTLRSVYQDNQRNRRVSDALFLTLVSPEYAVQR